MLVPVSALQALLSFPALPAPQDPPVPALLPRCHPSGFTSPLDPTMQSWWHPPTLQSPRPPPAWVTALQTLEHPLALGLCSITWLSGSAKAQEDPRPGALTNPRPDYALPVPIALSPAYCPGPLFWFSCPAFPSQSPQCVLASLSLSWPSLYLSILFLLNFLFRLVFVQSLVLPMYV